MKRIIVFTALLVCIFGSCKKEREEYPNPVEKIITLSGFTKVKGGETFGITITKGETFSIKAKGRPADLDDLALKVENNLLHLEYSRNVNNRYRVDFTITMPALTMITLDGSPKAVINGFQDQDIRIQTILAGSSDCTINGAPENIYLELSGVAVLNASGTTDLLYGNIGGQSRVNSYDLHSKVVEINTSGQSKAFVFPLTNLIVEASGQSEVYYRGTPTGTELQTSGQAKIVKQ